MIRQLQTAGSQLHKESRMEIGTIMMVLGILGMIASMVILFLLPGIFRKQRKKMMEEIGEDF